MHKRQFSLIMTSSILRAPLLIDFSLCKGWQGGLRCGSLAAFPTRPAPP